MRNKNLMGALVAASLLTLGAAAHAAPAYSGYGDIDRDGIQNRYDRDRDGDGIENRSDPQPNVWNPTRLVRGYDMDHDGIADRSDRDRDGDGIPNARDPNPNVPNERHVARMDHRGDHRMARSGDRDGDGVRNSRDRFPDNPRRS